ncbi:unnamed protein product [Calicophoron daubneyi]|uniref:Uncharacterized protein n=1 Tax=Calicophoron daubneyi TaxID=300641 RepID=A0AAV2T500_CALDB
MELATSLSKEERSRTLQEAIKRSKKKSPFPKYVCIPTSAELRRSICFLDNSSALCASLASLMHSYGTLPELKSCKSTKALKETYSKCGGCENVTKISAIRRFVIRSLKSARINDPANRNFWSHILLGVNQVMRRLEDLRIPADSTATYAEPYLSCVLLDAGWLSSQLGHHICHLCAESGVRLAAVRPVGSLAQLTSTDFRTLTRVIAIGICRSSSTPPDLLNWINQVWGEIGPLRLTALGSTDISRDLSSKDEQVSDRGVGKTIKRSASAANLDESTSVTSKPLSSGLGSVADSWRSVRIDASKLYILPPSGIAQAPTDPKMKVVTLDQLWSELALHESSVLQGEKPSDSDGSRDLTNSVHLNDFDACTFIPPIMKMIEPQGDVERKLKKAKKNKRKKKKVQAVTVTVDCGGDATLA